MLSGGPWWSYTYRCCTFKACLVGLVEKQILSRIKVARYEKFRDLWCHLLHQTLVIFPGNLRVPSLPRPPSATSLAASYRDLTAASDAISLAGELLPTSASTGGCCNCRRRRRGGGYQRCGAEVQLLPITSVRSGGGIGSAGLSGVAAAASVAAFSNPQRFFTFDLMDNKSKVKKELDDTLPPPPRKGLKFAPKVPPKKAPKTVPKTEPTESKDETIDKELLMKLRTSTSTDAFGRRVKTEKKESPAQVAFGQVNSSIARSFPMPRSSSADVSAAKLPKEYVEPWDYTHSNYPVTLPLRRPYSGNPEILDEEEFGESSASRARDGELTAAEELGLMDRKNKPQLLFFQLPASLPLLKRPEPNAGADTDSKERVKKARPPPIQGSRLKELPGGLMGKILVYKSGKVKMKLGDALFDVSAGSNCMFVQDVAVINTREKHCCNLGEVSKRAVVTPDVDYLLERIEKME